MNVTEYVRYSVNIGWYLMVRRPRAQMYKHSCPCTRYGELFVISDLILSFTSAMLYEISCYIGLCGNEKATVSSEINVPNCKILLSNEASKWIKNNSTAKSDVE